MSGLGKRSLDIQIAATQKRKKVVQAEDQSCVLKTYYLKAVHSDVTDIMSLLMYYKSQMSDVLCKHVDKGIKFNITAECEYGKPSAQLRQSRLFKTENVELFRTSDIDDALNKIITEIHNEQYQDGWSLLHVGGIMLKINRYRPPRRSSYIKLPDKIANIKACINPKNLQDSCCFKWAVLSRFMKDHHPQRIDKRYDSLHNMFDFSGIDFPTPLGHIKIFEEKNSTVSVNVYALNANTKVYPLKVVEMEKEVHYDLLMLNSDETSHYCWIKNFSKLVRSQITAHHSRIEVCKRCLAHFQGKYRGVKLRNHKEYCDINMPIITLTTLDDMTAQQTDKISFTKKLDIHGVDSLMEF